MTYKIAQYSTAVDLSVGIGVNLLETELALANNPGKFISLSLFDQARYNPDLLPEWRERAFSLPTGWNGSDWYYGNGFSTDIWSTTGIDLLEPSNVSANFLDELRIYAAENRSTYADSLANYLVKTGSSLSSPGSQPDIFLGLSTPYQILAEKQSGSPETLDFLLGQANSESFLGENPHALILSNHGGSFYFGTNGDPPWFDNDPVYRHLQIVEIAEALEQYTSTPVASSPFGLLAFDECLMANVETVTELADSTRYFLASQQTIPGLGYDYFITLSDFEPGGPLATREDIEDASKVLGLGFVSTYSDRNGFGNTLSLTDTQKITTLNEAIKAYADALLELNDSFLVDLLKALRGKGTNYAYKFLQDLGNLAMISKSIPGATTELEQASDAILNALDSAVVANNQNYRPSLNGYDFGKSSGLTISLPTESRQLEFDDIDIVVSFGDKAPKFEAETGWSRVLTRIAPLLQDVETNSGFETAVVDRLFDGVMKESSGDEAWYALQINGYLSEATTSSSINADVFRLNRGTKSYERDLTGIGLQDLTVFLDILTMRSPGSVTVSLFAADNAIKAAWDLSLAETGLYELSVQNLNAGNPSAVIELGDRLIVNPTQGLSAAYDLDVKINNHIIGLPVINPDPIKGPSLINTSIALGNSKTYEFKTPVLPPLDDGKPAQFLTSIVLLSGGQDVGGYSGVSLRDTSSGAFIQFESTDYVDEYVELNSGTPYEFTISYRNPDLQDESFTRDLAFQFDYFAAPDRLFADGLLNKQLGIERWGLITVDPGLAEPVKVVETVSSTRIRDLQDLQEGVAFDRKGSIINVVNVDAGSTLQSGTGGGTHAFSSGIWAVNSDTSVNVFIEGMGANAARFGFYRVDELTGAIRTNAGLIMPGATQDYLNAAQSNLLSPLVSLERLDKRATVEVPFVSGENYAAILITEDAQGASTALYSVIGANPTESAQMLDFGNGYYGFEDLVRGRDLNWDGDYNDVTFYLA